MQHRKLPKLRSVVSGRSFTSFIKHRVLHTDGANTRTILKISETEQNIFKIGGVDSKRYTFSCSDSFKPYSEGVKLKFHLYLSLYCPITARYTLSSPQPFEVPSGKLYSVQHQISLCFFSKAKVYFSVNSKPNRMKSSCSKNSQYRAHTELSISL